MKRASVDPELLKQLYRENRNIMAYLREQGEAGLNDEAAILAAYDMQAGTYMKAMEQPEVREKNQVSTGKFAALFDQLGCTSLLHGGTGEAKTISHVVEQMKNRPEHVYGFDICLSRLLYAREYARRMNLPSLRFFEGSLLDIPIRDNGFDIVFTSHSMEPNGGREREILQELYRVSRRYLVLREPSYELGNEETRAHIDRHGYVKNIPATLKELGYEVVEHRLFGDDENPRNQSALTVIRKGEGSEGGEWEKSNGHPYASPISKTPLAFSGEAYYSERDCLIFPVVSAIPCLLAEHGIFSSKYMNFFSPQA